MSKTFKEWIVQFKENSGADGDIARDIAADGCFPMSNDYEEVRDYLTNQNACDPLMELFENAWEVYEKY